MKVKTYEELEVWRVAMELAERVYELQKTLLPTTLSDRVVFNASR